MFSERLKKVRKIRKLTQTELALKVNTTKASISNYENGYSSPSNEMLKDLADALHTNTDYLLGRSEHHRLTEDMTMSEKTKELMKILDELPEEKRGEMEERILAYARGWADANNDD